MAGVIGRADWRGELASRLEWVYEIEPQDIIFRGAAYRRAKRIMDVGLIVLIAPLWLPVLALSALCILIHSPRDPVFFIQERTGYSGRRFRMFKLRTMLPEASQMTAEICRLSRTNTWPDIKIPDDPRVTTIGRCLRATHLDELPQLINVLRGDMSLVGPRPTSYTADTYPLWHTVRLEVPPGITGLWQLTQKSVVEFNEKTRLDVAYIRHQCLWLDIQILVRTAWLMLCRCVRRDI